MTEQIMNFLRWSQKYTKTDMIYVVSGSFWWISSKMGVVFLGFITMIAFANLLPKEIYGTYQFVISGLFLLTIFSLPGINTSIIKSIAQGMEGTLGLAVKNKIKYGLIGSIFSLILANYYFLQENNILGTAFLLGALFIPLKETFRIFIYFWIGRKKFDLQARYDLISSTLSTFLLISSIYLTNNVLIIISVFLASHTFFDWFFYKKTLKQVINDKKDESAISFGKNLTLINALQTAAEHLDKIIIWKFLGATSVAIYAFAQLPIQKVRDMLPVVPLALPKLSENKINENKKKGVISKFFRLFIFTIPSAAGLAFIAPFLYRLFFPQYIESVIYFQALSTIIAISPFLLFTATLTAEMKKGALYVVNSGAPFLKIVLFITLVPHFGIWGIVMAILVAELLRGLLALYFFLKI